MAETVSEGTVRNRTALARASILIGFVVAAIAVVRFPPVTDYLIAEALGHLLDEAGLWAPFVFILIYAAGVCFFIPGTLLTGLDAAIFEPY